MQLTKRLNSLNQIGLTVLLSLIGALILLTPPVDPDFGWHYKYGEYTVMHKSILKSNDFSYMLTDYAWANSYWLSQVLIYLIYNQVGGYGLSFINGLILTASLLTLNKKLSLTNKVIFMLFITTMLYEFTITVRPLYFSSLFFLIFFGILIKNFSKYGKLLPILFLIWASMHADFIIALAILLFFVFIKVWHKESNPTANIAIWVTSACATLINPYGLGLWKTLLLEINPDISSYKEFAPIYAQSSGTTLIASGIFIMLVLISTNKKSITWEYFVLAASFILGVRSLYFYRIFLLLAVFMIDKINLPFKALNSDLIKKVIIYGAGIVVPFLLIIKVNNIEQSTDEWAIKYGYPVGAIQYLKSNHIDKNMFNFYDWGGFLVWQLPEYKTFVDGRMAAWKYNNTLFVRYYKSMRSKPYENQKLINEIFETNNIGLVLDKPSAPIIGYLINNENWQIKYEDKDSVIIAK